MKRDELQLHAGFTPGKGWKALRVVCQALAFVAIITAPVLGGWQRLERNYLAAWDGEGWDLPAWLLDALPRGDAPSQAYDAIVVAGGGSAVDYFGVPLIDPVAGLVALFRADLNWTFAVAWGLPMLFGVLAGRAFCGWFCPFGTIARLTQALRDRVPGRLPHLAVPQRRPLRWLILLVSVGVGAWGGHSMLYLLLPHVLVQETVYGMWLMGGGGLLLGWLLGLVVAGFVFGPTLYCSTLCPTGAAFSLGGRTRVVHLSIVQAPDCGKNCNLCSRACWLNLDPASGDPGPDCDSCGRCVAVCPRANLQLGFALRRRLRTVTAALLASCLMLPATARAQSSTQAQERPKPRLVVNERVLLEDVQVAISVMDLQGIRLDADDPSALTGSEVDLVLVRGEVKPDGDLGKLAWRKHYAGPLEVELITTGGRRTLRAEQPTWPRSTPRRTIYRWRVEDRFAPGDRVIVRPVAGWFDAPITVEATSHRRARSYRGLLLGLGSGVLAFGGLLSLALALGGAPASREAETTE